MAYIGGWVGPGFVHTWLKARMLNDVGYETEEIRRPWQTQGNLACDGLRAEFCCVMKSLRCSPDWQVTGNQNGMSGVSCWPGAGAAILKIDAILPTPNLPMPMSGMERAAWISPCRQPVWSEPSSETRVRFMAGSTAVTPSS